MTKKSRQRKITTFLQLLEAANQFTSLDGLSFIFRGQVDRGWRLLPKGGRPPYYEGEDRTMGRFRDWSRNAHAYADNLPDNPWERLALAQHHGLATRLLDWTCNPLVAAYFAVYEHFDSDGVIYTYSPNTLVDPETAEMLDTDIVGVYRPKPISQRILNQQGVFTYHGHPYEPLGTEPMDGIPGDTNLFSIRIAKEAKHECLERLNNFGINQKFLFPDLDGLSRHVNWQTEEINRGCRST